MITSKRFLLKIHLKEFMKCKDINIIPEEKNYNLLLQVCDETEMVSSTSKSSEC